MTSAPFPITVPVFEAHVREAESAAGYVRPAGFGIGVATIAPSGKVLDVSFGAINFGANFGSAAVVAEALGHTSGTATYRLSPDAATRALGWLAAWADDHSRPHPNLAALRSLTKALPAGRGGERIAVVSFLGALSDAPIDTIDVWFRLHLMSTRKTAPRSLNLDGVFGLLNNVVWTNLGPFDVEGFDEIRFALIAQGVNVQIDGIDKFPRMTDYVVPSGVRIADASRVRLGAHLAEGTTVMHEGFCNFNAGTLGASMVEGRISQGVVVGQGADIGGGASIQGTLSGGGKEVVSVGEGCLLGANSGLGIALGDNCIVEAGLYLTAGTKVKLPDGEVISARGLSGASNLLFIRNSQTGGVEARANKVAWTGLNAALHKN